MNLFIDTSSRDKIILKLDEKLYVKDVGDTRSQMLLPFLDEVLKKEKKTIHDIKKLEVATGPGSFTGIRVGVSAAQTLAYLLNVPLNDRSITEVGHLEINY